MNFRDPTGNFYTQALFLELSYHKPDNAIYTLKDEDYEYNGKTYISIKRLYMEIGDPTEYDFAIACFAGWNHWKRLCDKTGGLKPYIADWRDELAVKIKSEQVKRIAREAASENRGALQAARVLLDRGWIDKKTAGRPTKEQVEGELKQQANIKKELEKDLERINVH